MFDSTSALDPPPNSMANKTKLAAIHQRIARGSLAICRNIGGAPKVFRQFAQP
jgi:hypothetical protein